MAFTTGKGRQALTGKTGEPGNKWKASMPPQTVFPERPHTSRTKSVYSLRPPPPPITSSCGLQHTINIFTRLH